MIITVLGLPGSGKSFFAARLAQKIEAVYISSDNVRKAKNAMGRYKREDKLDIYHTMKTQASEALLHGKKVVVDATFYRQETRDLFKELANEYNSIIHCIYIEAAEDLIRERLRHPREDSEANFAVYQLIKQEFEPCREPHLILQSGRDNIEEMLVTAISYISQPA